MQSTKSAVQRNNRFLRKRCPQDWQGESLLLNISYSLQYWGSQPTALLSFVCMPFAGLLQNSIETHIAYID